MAEALARQVIAQKGWQDKLEVSSAGIAAVNGMPASSQAIEVLGGQGLDLTAHRSSYLDKAMVEQADLVLTMTRSHQQSLTGTIPMDKLFTIGEYAGQPGDVQDPFGATARVYAACADKLAGLVEKALVRAMTELK